MDLNSFFASCEQQEDPQLRGRPVVVVPSLADTTSVIAASYEAKKMGIKTNTKVAEAKKMCPGLILKTGNHRLYTDYHHRIIKAVQDILPIKKVLSIDEVACELIGKERDPSVALKLAQNMKDHVRKVVGSEIKSSVGIGPNILIAKMASDMQKPDGLVSVSVAEIQTKLGPLPIEAIPGVGPKTKARFNSKGYFTVSDLLKLSEFELKKQWGSIWGLRVAKELQGMHIVSKDKPDQKSISHQHVLPPDLRKTDLAFQVLIKLLSKALMRLRSENQKATHLSIHVKFLDQTQFENKITFQSTDDNPFYISQLKNLWPPPSDIYFHKKKPLFVSVVLSGLTDSQAQQLSFFDDPKKNKMNQVIDMINSKHGHNTLFLASTQSVMKSGKTRISFNHIPNLQDEFED